MAAPVLVTRRTLAAAATARWCATYPRTHLRIAAALGELGRAPDPDAVDAAIGNDSWTRVPTCDGCERRASAVVRVGDDPDYESSTAYLCADCLRAALDTLKETT